MRRVLIVEDERIIAMSLSHQLKALGLETVAVTGCARDALSCLLREDVELVFMDVGLAGQRSGIEAARVMHETYNVPIVFMSAFSDAETEKRAREAGGVAFLSKPAEDEELRQVLRNVFD